MRTFVALALSLMGVLGGCVADADPIEPPSNDPQPDAMPGNAIVPRVVVDWNSAEVEDIARHVEVGAVDLAAVHLRLTGTMSAAGGSEIAIAIGARTRNGHPIENSGSWSWDQPRLSSDDYSAGSCGTWQAIRTSRGLICRAPGDAASMEQTTWSYQQLDQFNAYGNGWDANFYVTAYDTNRQELLCERILVAYPSGDFANLGTASYPACP